MSPLLPSLSLSHTHIPPCERWCRVSHVCLYKHPPWLLIWSTSLSHSLSLSHTHTDTHTEWEQGVLLLGEEEPCVWGEGRKGWDFLCLKIVRLSKVPFKGSLGSSKGSFPAAMKWIWKPCFQVLQITFSHYKLKWIFLRIFPLYMGSNSKDTKTCSSRIPQLN
jgi:hypothetical protein